MLSVKVRGIEIVKIENIFELPEGESLEREFFEDIIRKPGLLIERIISSGQVTPADEWYNQGRDELVLLISGEAVLKFDDDTQIGLIAGDYLLIPAHCRHRVEQTSVNPPCVWLAIHGRLTNSEPVTPGEHEI